MSMTLFKPVFTDGELLILAIEDPTTKNELTVLGGRHDQKTHGRGRGGSAAKKARVERALKSHNPASKEKQDASEAMEKRVASAVGGSQSGDNRPMDVLLESKNIGLEVKMMHDAKANKVHMRKDSRQRKEKWIKAKKGRKAFTVIIDGRDTFQGGKHKDKFSGHKIYFKEGVGAFRLSTMKRASSMADLKKQIGA